MDLALLVSRCEDELICDMAETYHVLNWRELPLRTAAILASGLPQDSRCRRKLSGQKLRILEYTQLAIIDELRLLVYSRTEDAVTGKNRPKSILKEVLHQDEIPKTLSFRTPEEFEARRMKIIKGD